MLKLLLESGADLYSTNNVSEKNKLVCEAKDDRLIFDI